MSILDWIWFFESLSQEDRTHLSYFCQKKHIASWEQLFAQWDDPNAFYIVVSGSFTVLKEESGNTIQLGPVLPGDILWEMALFWENTVRNATVTAAGDSSVITILDFSIKELTKKNPEILERIQKIVESRV